MHLCAENLLYCRDHVLPFTTRWGCETFVAHTTFLSHAPHPVYPPPWWCRCGCHPNVTPVKWRRRDHDGRRLCCVPSHAQRRDCSSVMRQNHSMPRSLKAIISVQTGPSSAVEHGEDGLQKWTPASESFDAQWSFQALSYFTRWSTSRNVTGRQSIFRGVFRLIP